MRVHYYIVKISYGKVSICYTLFVVYNGCSFFCSFCYVDIANHKYLNVFGCKYINIS